MFDHPALDIINQILKERTQPFVEAKSAINDALKTAYHSQDLVVKLLTYIAMTHGKTDMNDCSHLWQSLRERSFPTIVILSADDIRVNGKLTTPNSFIDFLLNEVFDRTEPIEPILPEL